MDKIKKEPGKTLVIAAAALMINIVIQFALFPYKDGLLSGIKHGTVFTAVIVFFHLWKNWCEKHEKWSIYQLFFWILTPAAAFFACELLVRENILELGIKTIFANYLIYTVVFQMILLIFRRQKLSTGIFFLCTLGFAAVNYYVTMFRGTPVAPMDIFAWKTAASVAGGYMGNFQITKEIVVSVEIAVIWLCFCRSESHHPGKIKERLVCGGCALAAAAVIAAGGLLEQSFDFWDLQYNIEVYGLALNFVSQVSQSKIEKPADYDYAKLEQMAEKYRMDSSSQAEMPEKLPSIIAIMNESFADLQMIRQFETSEPVLTYFNQLKDNTIKGKAYVSIFGGATCNTEYEFLTGNSLAFLPQGSLPFQQYVNGESNSIASLLRSRGYETIGIHPYNKNSWNRDKVYQNMGIDQFIGASDFPEGAEIERDLYINDEESYKMVIQKFEESKAAGKPAFIFNVTMQNHGGYLTEFFQDGNRVQISEAPGVYRDAEEYLTLLKKSDEDIHVLIDYFKQEEEPVAILFFGDHQPGLSDDFYNFLYGKDASQLDISEVMEKHQVPFFIWANYDIEEEENVVTSVNFLTEKILETAGIPLSPYMEFLKEVQQTVLAMSNRGYMEEELIWYGWSGNVEEILKDYEKFQYNNMFDKKKLTDFYY